MSIWVDEDTVDYIFLYLFNSESNLGLLFKYIFNMHFEMKEKLLESEYEEVNFTIKEKYKILRYAFVLERKFNGSTT